MHPTEVFVALALLDFTNSYQFAVSRFLVARPSLDRISRCLGISVSQVRRWRNRLVERGAIMLLDGQQGGRGVTTTVQFVPGWFVDSPRIEAWARKDSAYPGPVETLASTTQYPGISAQKSDKTLAYKMPPEEIIKRPQEMQTRIRARRLAGNYDFKCEDGKEAVANLQPVPFSQPLPSPESYIAEMQARQSIKRNRRIKGQGWDWG
jgi:hypothetical protein